MPPRTTVMDVLRWFGDESRRKQDCPLPAVAEFMRSGCSETYFLTFTDRRRLSAEQFSRDLGWTLHKANQAFFGTHYKRRGTVFLATYAVQETSFRDGLHTHLIVGIPDGSLALKPNKPAIGIPEFLIDAWVQTNRPFRSKSAQDWRPVTDLEGLFGYIQKTSRSVAALDHVDVGNTTFPTTYAVPDRG